MKRNCLVTGTASQLMGRFNKALLGRNFQVATTISPDAVSTETTGEFPIEWNRLSPLSARKVMINAISQLGSIDDFFIMLTPSSQEISLHEMSIEFINQSVDEFIKPQLYMLKEIFHYIQKQKKGRIFFVFLLNEQNVLTPVDALHLGGAKDLCKTLFDTYQNEEFSLNGFISDSEDIDKYISFILKSIEGKASVSKGRLYRFNDKGILSSFSANKRI